MLLMLNSVKDENTPSLGMGKSRELKTKDLILSIALSLFARNIEFSLL